MAASPDGIFAGADLDLAWRVLEAVGEALAVGRQQLVEEVEPAEGRLAAHARGDASGESLPLARDASVL